ncbi:MAG: DUF222 domain-containing protein, partial [Chloroflexi bacterium]
DAQGALAEANRAYERRYLHVGEPQAGFIRLDGLLDAEGGATLRTALNVHMLPGKDDDRTPGQRRADALVEICRRPGKLSSDGAGPRPQLIITASVDTLAGIPGAPAARLDSGAMIPSATVQRLACDAAITRITGLGEFDQEVTHASRSATGCRSGARSSPGVLDQGRSDRPAQPGADVSTAPSQGA